jgi:hypothetical protein
MKYWYKASQHDNNNIEFQNSEYAGLTGDIGLVCRKFTRIFGSHTVAEKNLNGKSWLNIYKYLSWNKGLKELNI